MCTSIIVNKKKTLVGWNLDILGMTHQVRATNEGVYIEIMDEEGRWLPLFGANNRGDFVGMPTCHPFDARSNPPATNELSETSSKTPDTPATFCYKTILLDIDLLLQNRTFDEIRKIAETEKIYSEPDVTFMSSLSDKNGNVLHIIPGQGYKYYERPEYQILTNFSPFKMNSEEHPWMGWDRYNVGKKLLEKADEEFDVKDCFEVLKNVSQEVCPTEVSMVYDVTERTVYWCEHRNWEDIKSKRFEE